LAIGIAGAGRIAFNSVVSLRFGTVLFGQYAAMVAAVILVGSLASAGPAAATTLGVARRWAVTPGVLPISLLYFLSRLGLWFLLPGVVAGILWATVRGTLPPFVWVVALMGYVAYQVARAFGYSVQQAGAITRAELIGAVVPILAVLVLAARAEAVPDTFLVLVFASGPLGFLVTFGWLVRRSVRLNADPLDPEERRTAIREGLVFFVGAGSSMTMQYLPVIIAERLQETTTAALLFGAVQATAPLLLFSRVYGAVMMPAFAGKEETERAQVHVAFVRPFFVATLAVALGIAPWVVWSLGLSPTGRALSIGALVALMTLMQVWATPAVTVLGAQRRERVPALASLAGLGVASGIWIIGAQTGETFLLPVGLALGAVIRSLVPMWVISGRPVGRFDRERRVGLLAAVGISLVVVVTARATPGIALFGGALLAAVGLGMVYRTWRHLQPANEDPAR